ncbi:WG repeat-containing protein [Bacteroidales bacterium OttesenSCG-928-J16]|nr:WG repeat-containing protein [Bacteroidales bacterium OttesenSCG-928-J16]
MKQYRNRSNAEGIEPIQKDKASIKNLMNGKNNKRIIFILFGFFVFQNALAYIPNPNRYVNKENGLVGVAEAGTAIIYAQYEDVYTPYASSLNRDFIIVKLKGKLGVVNSKNEFIVPPIYEYEEFKSKESSSMLSLCLIPFKQNELWGYMTALGEVIIPAKFSFASCFNNETKIANVRYPQNKETYMIDLYENQIGIFKHDEYGKPKFTKKQKLFLEQNNELYNKISQRIDSAYKVALQNVGVYESQFTFANAKIQQDENGLYGIVDSFGESIIPYAFDNIFFMNDQVASVTKDGKEGLVDALGRILTECKYDIIFPFDEEGLAEIRIGNKQGKINKRGVEIEPIELYYIRLGDEEKPGLSNISTAEREEIAHRGIGYYMEALDINPDNSFVYKKIGDCFYFIRNYDAAIAFYEESQNVKDLGSGWWNIHSEIRKVKVEAGYIQPPQQTSIWDILGGIVETSATLYNQVQTMKGNNRSSYNDGSSTGAANSNGATSKNVNSSDSTPNCGDAWRADSRTYSSYDTQLIKMRTYPENYSNYASEYAAIQSKMKQIREKWEARGCKITKSQYE